ncbi:TNF receptor-associated factor 5-like [Sitodiplosis mosellana]|uniref:TNF receptor-associated factor 5-like n=1 Tax=Sitodiplosis mosellana TaxID=263140 RepID=UPI002444B62A|nr:TNF receptor-associated factor 5-like [Sitodiplosis mosellana]
MDNGGQLSIRTETKYNVVSCHYCNEFIDNSDFKSHLDECGQALQKCPNDCLAYIQRKFLEQHLVECPKNPNGNSIASITDRDDEFFVLEQNITLLRSALHEEIRQRHRLIADVGSLRKAFAAMSENHAIETDALHTKFEDISQQCKEVKQWRKELRDLLDRISQDLEFRNGATLSFELLFSEKDRTSVKLNSLEKEIDNLKVKRERTNESTTSNNGLDSYYQSGRSNEYGSLGRNKPTPDRCRRCTFLEWKVSESLVELRQMKNIVYETEVKCEKSRATVIDAQKMCAKTKQELADLQTHLAAEKRMQTISNSEGHLIWRVDHFAAKLKDAKANDIIFKSPIFSNTQYGYSLRLDLLLNGLGKWKGRNLLACLTLVAGEWDTLLRWPCKLKADIILRNQTNDSTTPNISKTIVVKKQDSTYEQNQYIFISHRTIQNEDFLKDDCIFLEVFVHDT